MEQQARILIVDDDACHVQLLRRALEREGYSKIESTGDSRRVVDLVSARPPDVIVLDVHMPYLDGFGVLSELARDATLRVAPAVLVVSSDESLASRRAMFVGGASDYVLKPYDATEVALRIRGLAKTVRGQREALRLNDILTRQIADMSETIERLSRCVEQKLDDR